MKYGNTLIVLAIINVLVAFSGLPTGWKKIVAIAIALVMVFVGWVLRVVERRKRERAERKLRQIEEALAGDIDYVVGELAQDVASRVETEIEIITEQHAHDHEESRRDNRI